MLFVTILLSAVVAADGFAIVGNRVNTSKQRFDDYANTEKMRSSSFLLSNIDNNNSNRVNTINSINRNNNIENDIINNDDDGWGSKVDNNHEHEVVKIKSTDTTFDANKSDRYKQLEALKESNNLTSKQQRTDQSSLNDQVEQPDLFVPIFTIVSIIGFMGAYGYETLRLYWNDELYLPF